ncbi:MAG: ATP12 family protein [Pseudolabrys sp.]|jgi:chaperone required for assembly of F1-ATPase
MRDILTEIFENQPLDPMVSARQGARQSLRKRFYKEARRGEATGKGFPLLLDGKPVMTPARRPLVAPSLTLADALVREWDAQAEVIDPARMPVTRLANVIIDGVAAAPRAIVDEIAKYLGSDLVCYRADEPAGLVARQNELWNPLLDWAHETLGARFVLIEGIVFAEQPPAALEAARVAIPSDPNDLNAMWRLGAMASITTITGSALIALALNAGAFDADALWTAAHVDEDWQMTQWGRDDMAIERRAARFAEYEAAASVLRLAP